MQQQDPATIKALEVAKKLSRTLIGGGEMPVVNQGTILIPSEKVGMIIGKGGTTIKEIETSTNVKLQIESTGEPERKMFITGSKENVTKAKTRIRELLDSRAFKGRGAALNPARTIQIPSDQVGLVIGRGGENIKKICWETACHLKIEREDQAALNGNPLPAKGCQNLHIMGTPEAAENAERAVLELLYKDNALKLQRGTAGYGAHNQLFYQLQQGYSSLLQPYPSAAPIIPKAYSTAANGYPGVSYAYPQQQLIYPPQTYTVQGGLDVQHPKLIQQSTPVGQPA